MNWGLGVGVGWIQDDSRVLHLLCTLFLSAPPQIIMHELPIIGDDWLREIK